MVKVERVEESRRHSHDALAVKGISADSRATKPGDLFVAMAGAKDDGARFVGEALASGAVAVMAERVPPLPLPEGIAFIRVGNARLALALAAAKLFSHQPEVIAAVTGTSGKTSVAAFTRQIWAALGETSASIGTVGLVSPTREIYGSLTTPDPVALHRSLHELAGEGKLHGIYIVLDPRSPDLTRLTGDLLVPVAKRGAGMPSMSVSGTAKLWDTLKLGDKRIVGKLNYSRKGDDSLGWLPVALQVEFDAPISGSDVKVRTLTGAEAQNSPQATVYLAYEETMIKEGWSSALKKYATPQRLALIQEQMRSPGAEEEFKQFRAEMKASLPKGEARRKQVKKVTINENEAKLQMETGEEEDLVRLGGKWLLN